MAPLIKNEVKKDIIYAKECYQIMGIIFEVYNDLGYGHKEQFYQKAISNAFKENNIEFKEQLRREVKYKGETIGIYILDFLVFNKIIIELKQRDFFSIKDIQQINQYLKEMNLKLGILVHITSKGVRYKRIPNLID